MLLARCLLLGDRPSSPDLFLDLDVLGVVLHEIWRPSFRKQNLTSFQLFVKQPSKQHKLLEWVSPHSLVKEIVSGPLISYEGEMFSAGEVNDSVFHPLI